MLQDKLVMVKYSCHNCNDLWLKSITSVLDHVWDKHKIEVAKRWQPIIKAEDARLPPKKAGIRVFGFQCEECKSSLGDIPSFLSHLDEVHGIHIWYEKGIARKRVFFDGILDVAAKEDTEQQKLFPKSKKYLPLTKRPYEAREQRLSLVPKKKKNIPLSKRSYEPRKSNST